MSDFKKKNSGFTLIELLVVIGIIAVLAGTIGLSLQGNNPDSAVRSAQGMLASALSVARGQAALNQADTAIVVSADETSENFLRLIQIVAKTSSTPEQWRQVGLDIMLPEGVYVVPPTNSTISGAVLAFDNTNGDWPPETRSSMFSGDGLSTSTKSAIASALGVTANKILIAKPINPQGMIAEGTAGGKLIVAPGRKNSPTTYVLENAAAVRGMVISRYGVSTLVNDAASLAVK